METQQDSITNVTVRLGVPEPIAALNRVKIIENNEPLKDLRTLSPRLTFGTQEEYHPYLRATVADMLKNAVDRLPTEFNLHVTSALRPLKRQKELWYMFYERYKKEHPEWPEATLRRHTNKYVAPFDQPAPPGHSTGGAVDVVLQKPDGTFVDLVPPNLIEWDLGHTWTEKVDPAIRSLRMMLLDAMLTAGFSNCRDEYWHYSYGDSAWAVRVGKSECCYGSIEPPA